MCFIHIFFVCFRGVLDKKINKCPYYSKENCNKDNIKQGGILIKFQNQSSRVFDFRVWWIFHLFVCFRGVLGRKINECQCCSKENCIKESKRKVLYLSFRHRAMSIWLCKYSQYLFNLFAWGECDGFIQMLPYLYFPKYSVRLHSPLIRGFLWYLCCAYSSAAPPQFYASQAKVTVSDRISTPKLPT